MYISIGKVSRLTGVSISTIRRWDDDKYLESNYRTKGNHRRYNYKKILQFLGIVKENDKVNVVIYARVSSSKQREDLKRQIELLENHTNRFIKNIKYNFLVRREPMVDLLAKFS